MRSALRVGLPLQVVVARRHQECRGPSLQAPLFSRCKGLLDDLVHPTRPEHVPGLERRKDRPNLHFLSDAQVFIMIRTRHPVVRTTTSHRRY